MTAEPDDKAGQAMLNNLRNEHLSGSIGGQVAVCSAHPQVLLAAADQTRKDGTLLLVEATANQVNLSGGYTGMTPADFAAYATRLAAESGLARGQIALGADHLGPYLWRQLSSTEAMAQAEALARAFSAAGYQKLHLDTGMGCGDDPPGRLPVEIAAQRAAVLCKATEAAALNQMVRDHFTLLKVGPCLTSALREALFALAQIEDALPNLGSRSNLITVMEQLMQAHPEHWRSHYHGTEEELHYLRRYSLRDRIRYYWPHTQARQACDHLINNLRHPIPHPLLQQFLPDLGDAIADGALPPTYQAIIQARIQSTLHPYTEACRRKGVD